ncbi:MAG: hypothetical protein IPK32_09720 [Verrucomicrobiaceae bacterium]|nr:hypothetical protein [Verrucomicrobiaceae bacterium]
MKTAGTDLACIYTPIREAVEILQKRRREANMTIANALECLLATHSHAVLFRQVATPNFEMQRFVTAATSAGLKPLVLEYHEDKFVHFNPAKHSLLKMRFHSGTGRNGGERIRCLSIAEMNGSDGKRLRELHTRNGVGIVPFHHALMDEAAFSRNVVRHDGSQWFQKHGGSADNYYPELFRLFLRHAVLFESFLTVGNDAAFTSGVVMPAFEAVRNKHGEQPVICRLDPVETEGDPYLSRKTPSFAGGLPEFDSSGSPRMAGDV